jgi:hypothetical protein
MAEKKATTMRFSDADQVVFAQIYKMTGTDNRTEVVRRAIRELRDALVARKPKK